MSLQISGVQLNISMRLLTPSIQEIAMKGQYIVSSCVLMFAVMLGSTPALAKDDCQVPIERWQSRDAALQAAAQQGWQVDRIKIDDGCYEIKGTDAKGRAFKAKLDPQTLETIQFKQRKPERKRERSSDD